MSFLIFYLRLIQWIILKEINYTIQTTNIVNSIEDKKQREINYIRYDYQGYFPFINLCDDTLLLKIELKKIIFHLTLI